MLNFCRLVSTKIVLEQAAVNRLVAGSSPARGAKKIKALGHKPPSALIAFLGRGNSHGNTQHGSRAQKSPASRPGADAVSPKKKLTAPLRVMNLDLTDEQTATLLRELDAIIENDRYFLSPRIRTLTAIRDKIRTAPVREPRPPLRH
jgi:hypothetical protein